MHVTQVRFESFKSLYDVTCNLDDFTVITGPNGAGKSNLVQALDFIGDIYRDGLEFAISRNGGYENIAHRRTRRARKPVTCSIEVRLDMADLRSMVVERPRSRSAVRKSLDDLDFSSVFFTHSFTFGTPKRTLLAEFELESETIALDNENGVRLLQISKVGNGPVKVTQTRLRRYRDNEALRHLVEPADDPEFIKMIVERPTTEIRLVMRMLALYSALFSQVSTAIAGTHVFQLSPHECRTSGVPTPNAMLARHGENLPGAAYYLRKSDSNAWHKVQRAMRAVLPGLAGVEVAYTEDRRLALQFREEGVGRPWNSGEVSDGTIQTFALLIAIYDSRSLVLVIEEPENSIHPWIVRQIMDLLQSDGHKQIILTTHSPIVLNYVKPSSVRLMGVRRGQSWIEPMVDALPELSSALTSGEVSIFEVYDSGVLVGSVPGGLSSLPGHADVDESELGGLYDGENDEDRGDEGGGR